MRLSLVNNVNQTIDLTESNASRFQFSIGAFTPRASFATRADKDGSEQTADLRTGSREINLRYAYASTTDSGFISYINALNGLFLPEYKPFYLVDSENARRIEVVLTNHSVTYDNGNDLRSANCSMALMAPDGYWESTSTTTSGAVLFSGQTVTINNPSNTSVYPVVTLTAGTNISSFRLTNQTNSGNIIQVESASYLSGSIMSIDSIVGRLTIDNVLTNSSITVGGLPYLLPGDNVFLYESDFSPVTVSFAYKRKWSF